MAYGETELLMKDLEEIKIFCEYFLDKRVNEVRTSREEVANCFCNLGFNVTECGIRHWSIVRPEVKCEETGYEF